MAANDTLTFSDSTFDQDVLKSDLPVLVDFWAPWCPPCRALTPTIDTLATDYIGKAKIGKLNVDDNQATAQRYQVRSIPTLLLFKGGELVGRTTGAQDKSEVQKLIDPHVSVAL